MTSPDARVGCVNGGNGAHANCEAVSMQGSVEAVRWSGPDQRIPFEWTVSRAFV